MRKYVEALGGKLQIEIELGDQLFAIRLTFGASYDRERSPIETCIHINNAQICCGQYIELSHILRGDT